MPELATVMFYLGVVAMLLMGLALHDQLPANTRFKLDEAAQIRGKHFILLLNWLSNLVPVSVLDLFVSLLMLWFRFRATSAFRRAEVAGAKLLTRLDGPIARI